MRYRKLGNTDLEITDISLGSWVFGGDCWGEAEDALSERVVNEAIEQGINIIDTAPIYGSGRSEAVIGKALKGKRKEVVIATKCGLKDDNGRISIDLTPKFIKEEIDNSLRRLDTDYIDLYQCHWPDEKHSYEETFTFLEELKKEGKILHIGVSNFTKAQIEKALKYADIVSNQMQYSILDRKIEKELIPFCEEKNISILAYGPLGGGILTGKYAEPPQMSKGDVKSFFYKFYKEPMWTKVQTLLADMKTIADKNNAQLAEVAINWVLQNPQVATCIVGARIPDQLRKNTAAKTWTLADPLSF